MLLYIKNLPPDATKNHIRALFAGMDIDEEGILLPGENSAYVMFRETTDLLEAYANSEMEDPEVLGQVVTFLLCKEEEMLEDVERLQKLKPAEGPRPARSRPRVSRFSDGPEPSTTAAPTEEIPGLSVPGSRDYMYDDIDGAPMEEEIYNNKKKNVNDERNSVLFESNREDNFLYDQSPGPSGQRSRPSSQTVVERSESKAPKLDYYQLITGGGKLLNYEPVSSSKSSSNVKYGSGTSATKLDSTQRSQSSMRDFYQGYLPKPSSQSAPEKKQLADIIAKRLSSERPKFTERKAELPTMEGDKVIVGYSDSDDSAKSTHGTERRRRVRDRRDRRSPLSKRRRDESPKRGSDGRMRVSSRTSRNRSRSRDRSRSDKQRSPGKERSSGDKGDKRRGSEKDSGSGGQKEGGKERTSERERDRDRHKEKDQAKQKDKEHDKQKDKEKAKSKEDHGKTKTSPSDKDRDRDKTKDHSKEKKSSEHKDKEKEKNQSSRKDHASENEKGDRAKDVKEHEKDRGRGHEKTRKTPDRDRDRASRDRSRSQSERRTRGSSRERQRSASRERRLRDRRHDRRTRSRSRSFSPDRRISRDRGGPGVGYGDDRRSGHHDRRPSDRFEGHYIFLENLPSWSTVYTIHQMFDDCSVIREGTKLVSNEGLALYAYLEVATQSDVYKACQRDRTSIGNFTITVKPLAANMYAKEWRELTTLLNKPGPKPLKVHTLYSDIPHGDGYSRTPPPPGPYGMPPSPQYGMPPRWPPPPHMFPHPLGPPMPHPMPGMPMPPHPPGMNPPLPPPPFAQFPPEGYQHGMPPPDPQHHPQHHPHPGHMPGPPQVRRSNEEFMEFIGFSSDDVSHVHSVMQYLKITIKSPEILRAPVIVKTPVEEDSYSVRITVDLPEDVQALPRCAIVGNEFCYIKHPRQKKNCPVCRHKADHPAAVGMCRALAPQTEIAIPITEDNPLSPGYMKDIRYKDKRYPSIMGVLDSLMVADIGERDVMHPGPKRHTWLLSKLNLLIELYQIRIENCDRSQRFLHRCEARKPIVLLDTDPVLGIGMQHLSDTQNLLPDLKSQYREGENMIGQVLAVHRDQMQRNPDKYREARNEQQFGEPGVTRAPNLEDIVDAFEPSFDERRRNHGSTPACEAGAVERISFNGFPDTGLPVQDLFLRVEAWLSGVRPGIKIVHSLIKGSRRDHQGGVYHIVGVDVEGPLFPALPAFNIINNVACIVKHGSQLNCCQVCKHPHGDDRCVGMLSQPQIKSYIFLNKSHALDPMKKNNQFTYNGNYFKTFLEAVEYLMRQDLGDKVVDEGDKHKIFTWEANNYALIKDVFDQQERQCKPIRNIIMCSLGHWSKEVIYVSDDLVLGSGTYSNFDIMNVKYTFLPGLNYYGRIVKEKQLELKNISETDTFKEERNEPEFLTRPELSRPQPSLKVLKTDAFRQKPGNMGT